MLGGRAPALFHVLVFPAWSWIPARAWSVSAKRLWSPASEHEKVALLAPFMLLDVMPTH